MVILNAFIILFARCQTSGVELEQAKLEIALTIELLTKRRQWVSCLF